MVSVAASSAASTSNVRLHAVSHFRPEVEGLRAAAVLLVVADHLFAQPSGGFVGVDVFFVISGFLVTGLLVREQGDTSSISIAGFYRRRAKRILPASVLVLIASAIAAHSLFYAARAHETLVDAYWSVVFLANQHFADVGTDYFNADRPPSPLQHFWSLAVEEQYYLGWPLLLLTMFWLARRIAPRHTRRLVLGQTMVLLVALLLLSLRETSDNRAIAYFATSARAWELGVGAVLALALERARPVPAIVRQLACPVGLIVVVASAFAISSSSAFPTPAALGPVAGAALVIIGGTAVELPLTAWPLTNLVSRYIGRISYSLYLWHWPVIVLLPSAVGISNGVAFDLVALMAMGALTVFSYHFVEKPLRQVTSAQFRRLGGSLRHPLDQFHARHRDGPSELGYAALATATLIVCAGAVWTTSQGASDQPFVTSVAAAASGSTTQKRLIPWGEVQPSRPLVVAIAEALTATTFPTMNPSIGQLSQAKAPEWKPCGNVGEAQLDQCTFASTKTGGPTKSLVVIGDSYAISWLPAIRATQAMGYTVYALTYGQCPAADVARAQSVGAAKSFIAECNGHRQWAVEQVRRIKPDVVVLASQDALEHLASGTTGTAALAEWKAGTSRIVNTVHAAGAKRIVVLSAPPESASLTACAPSRASGPARCVSQVTPQWHQVADVEREAVRAVRATYLDTRLLFCTTNDFCPAFVGHMPVKVDGSHLTDVYSASLGPTLAPLIVGADFNHNR